MIITAVFTVTLLIVFAVKGVGVVFDRPYPSAWMMGLALLGMLIFNGVYQNGEGGPPPLWLRIPTLITLVCYILSLPAALAMLLILIISQGLVDILAVRQKKLVEWYAPLRLLLSGVAGASLASLLLYVFAQ